MGLYDKLETDRDLETGSGVVLDYGDGVKIRIHRAGGSNQKFTNRQTVLIKPFQRQINNDTLPPEKGRELNIQLYAETVIVGWEGVTDRDGNPLPFTKENAIRVMTDLPDLFSDLVASANDRALFRKAEQEEAAGN